jgi:uncharacterized protein YhbP (UPF0306 family)
MDRNKKLEWIAALLRAESTLALATVDEGGLPSIAPLFYLVDESLTLYWLSSPNSQHSRNLLREPRAAVTVYRSVENWKEICGVQMRGRVEIVSEKARRKEIIERYCQRFQLGTLFHLAIRQSTLYAFAPEFIRAVDNSRHFGWSFELTLQRAGGEF